MHKKLSFTVLLLVTLFLSACNLPGSASTPTSTPGTVSCPDPEASGGLLGRMGRGVLSAVVYSPDGEFILAAFGTGISVVEQRFMTEIDFYPIPEEPRSLAFFPDGREVAVGTAQGQVLFFHYAPETGALGELSRPTLQGKDASNIPFDPFAINLLKLSPDARFLAVSTSFQIQIWDLRSGAALLKESLTKPDSAERDSRSVSLSFEFSSNSRYLLVQFFLVDLESGQVVWTSPASVFTYQFLADGMHLAYMDLDISRKSSDYFIFDIATLKMEKKIQLEVMPDEQPDLIFSADGETVAEIFDLNKSILLYHAATGELIKKFTMPEGIDVIFYPFVLSNSGLFAGLVNEASGSLNPFLADLSTETPAAFKIDFAMPDDYQYGIKYKFSPNGQRFLYYSSTWLAQADPATRKVYYLMDDLPPGAVTALSFSPDGSTLTVGKDPASLSIYQLSNLYFVQNSIDLQDKKLPAARHTPAGVSGLAYLPDGKRLAFITSPGWLELWPLDQSSPSVVLKPVESELELYGLAIAPDGRSLAVGGFERGVRIWQDLAGSSPTSSLLEDSSPVSALVYTPDGNMLAAGTSKGLIRLWDPASGLLLRTLKGHMDWVSGLVFTPDGESLISTSTDGTVRLWSVADGSQVHLLELGQPGASLALDPHGTLLALGAEDGKIYFWSLESNTWLGSLEAGRAGVSALTFSADGKRLALGLSNGQTQLWQLRDSTGKLVALAPGEPPAAIAPVCQIEPDSHYLNTAAAQAGYQIGKSYQLTWLVPYQGDCSAISAPSGVEPTGAVSAADFHFEDLGENLLRVTAQIELPTSPEKYDAAWKLTSAGGDFTLAAELTGLDQAELLSLPAPLFYLESGALMRLEMDGLTRSQVVEPPVQCMDVSPRDGSLAYLVDDELILANARGGEPRTLLPIAGCPSWSPDGSLIAYILNGVKLVQVADGKVTTLRNDLNVNGPEARVYSDLLGWSPFSNKFIARASLWESFSTVAFDVPTSYRYGLPGNPDVTWSRNGEYIYTGQAEYDCSASVPPYLSKTNIVNEQSETILGGSPADLRGARAPFESSVGRLLFFGSRLAESVCASDAPPASVLVPAQMALDNPTQVQYDEAHALQQIQSVLWWHDGGLALVSLGDETSASTQSLAVVIARPFTSQPLMHLVVNGSNLRWGPRP